MFLHLHHHHQEDYDMRAAFLFFSGLDWLGVIEAEMDHWENTGMGWHRDWHFFSYKVALCCLAGFFTIYAICFAQAIYTEKVKSHLAGFHSFPSFSSLSSPPRQAVICSQQQTAVFSISVRYAYMWHMLHMFTFPLSLPCSVCIHVPT